MTWAGNLSSGNTHIPVQSVTIVLLSLSPSSPPLLFLHIKIFCIFFENSGEGAARKEYMPAVQ